MKEFVESDIISEEELKQAIPAIFERAQVDNDFRQVCTDNPSQAVYEVTGKRLPDGAKLSFSAEQ